MTIYRSSGKNTEIYEEYELYTREYVENVGGKSTFTAKGGTIFGDNPKTAKPLEITNLYVKVRLSGEYKGEFGFDWVDVNADTKEIEKIQDVPFSDVEYFYKKGATSADLGDIIEKSSDETGAKHAIQDHYKFSSISKYVDMPYVLLKPNQEITLSAEIILWQGTINEDVVSITGDDFYEFEITGGEKEGKTTKKKITAAGKIEFKVKCLQAGTDKTYEFKHSNPTTGSHAVGGIILMENKVLKLKFRVIALVSGDGSPASKAKDLFQKFKDNDIKKYLNENSLNQAGYEVEIENQAMFDGLDTAELDDYFYAFDKTEWTAKNYYSIDERERPKLDSNGYGNKMPDGTWEKEKYNAETVFQDIKIDKGKKDEDSKPVIITKSVDDVTIEEYVKKLKVKSKSYSGGFIILVDGESKGNAGAFSRTTPFNYYGLVIYSKNTSSKETYPHEIGHMLGLNHIFYSGEEGFKKSWDILQDYKKDIINIQSKSGTFNITEITSNRKLILRALSNANLNFQRDLDKRNSDYNIANKSNGTFTWGDKPVTKSVFLEKSMETITKLENRKKSNIQAERQFLLTKDGIYLNYKKNDDSTYYVLKDDLLKIKEDYLKYYSSFLAKNYLLYKKGSTKNMLDYDNSKVRFQFHQIKLMREDYENY